MVPVQAMEKYRKNNRSAPISFVLTRYAVDADFRAAVYLCRGSGSSGY